MNNKPPHIPPETEVEAALWRAVGDVQDQQTELRELTLTHEQVAVAVEQGLIRAVQNPDFWAASTAAMQAHAAREAGGWLLGSVSAAFKRVAVIGLLAAGIYSVGGWSALVKAWAALRGA